MDLKAVRMERRVQYWKTRRTMTRMLKKVTPTMTLITKFEAMEEKVEHTTSTTVQASNVKMQIEKLNKRREMMTCRIMCHLVTINGKMRKKKTKKVRMTYEKKNLKAPIPPV